MLSISPINQNQTSFGSKITRNPFFEKGLKSAVNLVRNGEFETADKFCRAVKMIESDGKATILRFDTDASELESLNPYRTTRLYVDNSLVKEGSGRKWIEAGRQCVDDIIKFAEDSLGVNLPDNSSHYRFDKYNYDKKQLKAAYDNLKDSMITQIKLLN